MMPITRMIDTVVKCVLDIVVDITKADTNKVATVATLATMDTVAIMVTVATRTAMAFNSIRTIADSFQMANHLICN